MTGGSGFIGGALIRRLVADGWSVRGLARSDEAAGRVASAGAEPVAGDIADAASMRGGAEGCEYAFHSAAAVREWGTRAYFEEGNVAGTRNALEAARAAGVRRFVHVGSPASVTAGDPLVNVDESTPLRPDSKADYAATKAIAEQIVSDASGDGFETVTIRPRLVWGPGDNSLLPGLTAAVEAGRFAWIGGGRHRISTTHIDNAVESLVLAARRGVPGEAYFITDGEPVVFRDFVTQLLATAGVEPPERNLPAAAARPLAAASEDLWRLTRRDGRPPMTRIAAWLTSVETTFDISKARRELGYEPVKTIGDGMAELAGRS